MVFICQEYSFSLPSGVLHDSFKNCIFLHGRRTKEKKKRGGCGCGEYAGIYVPDSPCFLPFKQLPKLFWPPPNWVVSNFNPFAWYDQVNEMFQEELSTEMILDISDSLREI